MVTEAPLILQIQQSALDRGSSVTDALRKAKVACVKLTLREFQKWVDFELNGYVGVQFDDLPPYRKLFGKLASRPARLPGVTGGRRHPRLGDRFRTGTDQCGTRDRAEILAGGLRRMAAFAT
jgi:hypothetical protein